MSLIATTGLCAVAPTGLMKQMDFNRRRIGNNDVHIKVRYSGICHSDIHTVNGEWGDCHFPLCVGHEILGDVVAVGAGVTKFKLGDIAGVGCFVNSCRKCEECLAGDENYCTGEGGMSTTYGHETSDELNPGGFTMGGYSKDIVTNENYTMKIPANLNVAAAAPLLCAGITCYSPFKEFGVKLGHKVGVIGLGGLGHMAVKIAKAMGAEVTVFTRQESKRADAMAMGATNVVISTDEDAMEAAANTMHLVYSSISAKHDVVPYLNTLKTKGTMVVVGIPPDPFTDLDAGTLLERGLKLVGSLIGNISDTQSMIDFCAEHSITCDIELVSATPENVEKAWNRTIAADVRYRFVIDTAATMCYEAKE